MVLFTRHKAKQLLSTTSALLERVQRLETEQAAIRATLEGERQIRLLTANSAAQDAATTIGEAIEQQAKAMQTPTLRGYAGGLARARKACRYLDGTFMPESEKREAFQMEYERYARGGRARAETAERAPDGTFLPS